MRSWICGAEKRPQPSSCSATWQSRPCDAFPRQPQAGGTQQIPDDLGEPPPRRSRLSPALDSVLQDLSLPASGAVKSRPGPALRGSALWRPGRGPACGEGAILWPAGRPRVGLRARPPSWLPPPRLWLRVCCGDSPQLTLSRWWKSESHKVGRDFPDRQVQPSTQHHHNELYPRMPCPGAP